MSTGELNLRAVIGFGGSVPNGLKLHPDGQTVIYPLGSTVVLRNKEDPSQQSFLQGHDGPVSCIALSPRGQYLASGQSTHMGFLAKIVLWDLETLTKKHTFTLHKVKVQDLAFSPCENFLASLGGEDKNDLVLWDVGNLEPVCGSPTHPQFTSCVSFLCNSSSMIVTGGVSNLSIWDIDLQNRKLIRNDVNLGTLQRTVTSLTCDYVDKYVYCTTKTGDVLQITTDFKLLKARGPAMGKDLVAKGINCGAMLPNGDVVIGGDAGDLMVVGVSNPKLPKLASTKVQGGISTIAMDLSSWDGRGVIGMYVGTDTCNIFYVLYDANAGTMQAELLQTAHPRRINDISFPFPLAGMPMYSSVFATASRGEIRVWNIQTCRELLRIVVPNLECCCVMIQPDGKAILSGWSDGKIRAFGPQSGKVLYVINDAHHKAVSAINCSEDCSMVISGGEEGFVRVWRIGYDSQCMVASMKEHHNVSNTITVLRGTPSLQEFVSASSDGSCIVWTIDEHERLSGESRPKRHTSCFSNTFFLGAELHPDGSQIVTCGTDRKLTYWDAYDGTAIRHIEASDDSPMTCLAVDSDGGVVVTGSGDKLVKLYGYDDGHCYFVGKGHSSTVTRVAVTPDEDLSLRKIVSVGAEGAIMIWDFEDVAPQ